MIIIGHELIPYQKHYLVEDRGQIAKTPSNAVVFLKEFDMQLMHYLNENALRYSVAVNSTYELIVANAMDAAYIITKEPKKHQPIATNYLFDAKLLTFITNLEDIETLAATNIDGVIFKKAIVDSY